MNELREFLEYLIYRSMGSQRYTQESPILPDVWLAYGLEPGKARDLLLTPNADSSPAILAYHLRERLKGEKTIEGYEEREKLWPSRPEVAYNQTTVVARLHFHELIRVALPLSRWWKEYLHQGGKGAHPVKQFKNPEMRKALFWVTVEAVKDERYQEGEGKLLSANMVWLARMIGIIALANKLVATDEKYRRARAATKPEKLLAAMEKWGKDPKSVVGAAFELLHGLEDPWPDDAPEGESPAESADGEKGGGKSEEAGDTSPERELLAPCLWSINRNRKSEVSIYESVPTIKADASRRLFEVTGKGICWAVLDSGIDATHPAFRKRKTEDADPFFEEPFALEKGTFRSWWKNNTRVRATYDFTKIRKLLSADPDSLDGVPREMLDKATSLGLKRDLKKALKFGREIDWELLEPLLKIEHDEGYLEHSIPKHHHGSHVAGIIAADWPGSEEDSRQDFLGVCPEIELYDLRVLDQNGAGREFPIMAALQFIRYLNQRRNLVRDLMEVHGANLSFSIKHDVANYACGRTPVCEESERLVNSGVAVVAAAGNQGRAQYVTATGAVDDGYRPISITDPGNADAVITVGATHRRDPHTFGVSYFSSRGPTGDGRLKPDLVAPGEKIKGPTPNRRAEYKDGTSMAAPHVSGAAAMLMARHSELVGQPARIKQILCDTATDLGRERYFQGHGLVDTLRALQSV